MDQATRADRWRYLGWIVRAVLTAYIALEVVIWVDLLFFSYEEYDQVIGSECGCAVYAGYCSWPKFILGSAHFSALAVASMVCLMRRRLPHREWALRCLALAICGLLTWSAFNP
ncbi:MAG: hypothetical protein ACREEP_04870 [Dongiaceae bacterium]